VKWILRYLKGTSGVGLVFDGDRGTGCIITDYVDSDFVGDLDRRKLTTCYVFILVGGPISWRYLCYSLLLLCDYRGEIHGNYRSGEGSIMVERFSW